MAGFYGGDTEQMRMHGAASQRGAQRIADITAAMGASIDSVLWQGPDAEAFRALWHSSVKPGMLARAKEVRATGQELDQHAEQQEQARSEEHTSELQSRGHLVCRLLLDKRNNNVLDNDNINTTIKSK